MPLILIGWKKMHLSPKIYKSYFSDQSELVAHEMVHNCGTWNGTQLWYNTYAPDIH